MSEKNTNQNKDIDSTKYSLLGSKDIQELGKLMAGGPIRSITNPFSDVISSKARDHMRMPDKINLDSRNNTKEEYHAGEDASDNEASKNQGAFLHPADKASNATQGDEYAIEPPSAFSRLFAVQNLPAAYRITFGVGFDCWKSGDQYPFSFVKPKEVEIEKEEWSDEAVKELQNIGFLKTGPQHMSIGEMDGESLLILLEEGFDWTSKKAKEPRDPKKKILGVMTLPMYYVYRSGSVNKWTVEGLPEYWNINVNSIDGYSRPNAQSYQFHYSRVIHYCPEPLDTSTKGLCTLERAWQAICIGFNIDMGIGEAFFRWGIGHPVFTTEFETKKDLEDLMNNLGSPTRRTWHALLKGMDLKFVGAAGSQLDFSSGKEVAVYDELSIATGIPRPILKGEVAGVQTGSEVNERTYWGILRHKQTVYNEVIWKLLAILKQTGQVNIPELLYDQNTGIVHMPPNVIVKWAVHYVETEEQRIDILIKKLSTLNPLKDLLTINELRYFLQDILNKPEGTYPPLPNAIGNQLLSIYSDPYDLESSLSEEQLSQANLPYSSGLKGPIPGTTPSEKLATSTKSAPLVSAPGKPSAPREPRKQGSEQPKPQDENDIENSKKEIRDFYVIGCPDHETFHRTCPACITTIKRKEQLAYDYLQYGYSINDIASFLHLDRNKIAKIRQEMK